MRPTVSCDVMIFWSAEPPGPATVPLMSGISVKLTSPTTVVLPRESCTPSCVPPVPLPNRAVAMLASHRWVRRCRWRAWSHVDRPAGHWVSFLAGVVRHLEAIEVVTAGPLAPGHDHGLAHRSAGPHDRGAVLKEDFAAPHAVHARHPGDANIVRGGTRARREGGLRHG